MKKIILLAGLCVLSFAAGTVGVYLYMPSIAPDVVDSTRVRLDSLGLLAIPPVTEITGGVDSTPVDTVVVVQSDSAAHQNAPSPAFLDSLQVLADSLTSVKDLNKTLERDNSRLLAQIEDATRRMEKLDSQELEAEEVGKSLIKVEDKQLSRILAGLDLNVVERIYVQASARDRTRLLQNMPSDRAARFVKTLVKAPNQPDDMATTEASEEEQENETSN